MCVREREGAEEVQRLAREKGEAGRRGGLMHKGTGRRHDRIKRKTESRWNRHKKEKKNEESEYKGSKRKCGWNTHDASLADVSWKIRE